MRSTGREISRCIDVDVDGMKSGMYVDCCLSGGSVSKRLSRGAEENGRTCQIKLTHSSHACSQKTRQGVWVLTVLIAEQSLGYPDFLSKKLKVKPDLGLLACT